MRDAGGIDDIRSTVFLSCILHACFFAAVVVSSSYIMKSRMIMPGDNILFVHLSEDKISQQKKDAMITDKHVTGNAVPAKKEIHTAGKAQEDEVHPDASAKVTKGNTERADSLIASGPQATGPTQDIAETGLSLVTDPEGTERAIGVSQEKVPPAGTAGGVLSPDILMLIGGAIEKAKTYPPIARKRGMEGTVFVSFKIGSDGIPHDLIVLKSSGFEVLDTATLDAIKRAAPYPNIQSRVEVPVAYRLKE
ncbi:MAG: energy transducer TonB [Nitrospiraceae bacterium]|nr:MAG: energy transducer TonB [Nitrospiraceae bacterium]